MTHIVGPGLLGVHPLPVPVEERDQEERPPEDEVGHRDHEEHLHPGHSLPLHPLEEDSYWLMSSNQCL